MNWSFAGVVVLGLALAFWIGWSLSQRQLVKRIMERWPGTRHDFPEVGVALRDIDRPFLGWFGWALVSFLAFILIANALVVIWP